LLIAGLSPEQSELWGRVTALWASFKSRDACKIRSALHPEYVGWDMNAPLPHDRDAAVCSASSDAPKLRAYELNPLSIRVYDGRVGVVHYSYSATVVPKGEALVIVTGRWTEVYLKQGGAWMMISVSGRPDVPQ
jgi:hypothetical protein